MVSIFVSAMLVLLNLHHRLLVLYYLLGNTKNIMVHTRNAVKRTKAAIVESALFNNDILVNISPYLECSDLVSLALTSRRLGLKKLDNDDDCDWSQMEEVARQLLYKSQTNDERAALPRYAGESWITLLHELELLRSPLIFDQLIGDRIAYVRGNRACFTSSNPEFNPEADATALVTSSTTQTAICSNHIMRSGKHFATFTLTGCEGLNYWWPGIVRPIGRLDNFGLTQFAFWDHENINFEYLRGKRTDRWGEGNVNCCFYCTYAGMCAWGDWQSEHRNMVEWDGREGAGDVDCKIGMLLDLNQGTLTIYKDGRKLGVMKDGKILCSLDSWILVIVQLSYIFNLRTFWRILLDSSNDGHDGEYP